VEQQPLNEPFHVALRKLIDGRDDLSLRKLGKLTEPFDNRPPPLGGGYGHSFLSNLQAGPDAHRGVSPTMENIEVIADALGIPRTTFLEYRQYLAAERVRELVETHGLGAVMTALDAVSLDPAEEFERLTAEDDPPSKSRSGGSVRAVPEPQKKGRRR